MQMQRYARTMLVLGCLGLAGCASAQSQSPLTMAPAPQAQEPVRPPEAIPAAVPSVAVSAPVLPPVVQAAPVAPQETDTIVVNTRERVLYYTDKSGQTIVYRIGVGRAGFEWAGRAYVAAKKEWPDWTPPKVMVERELRRGKVIPLHMQGGIENPLGARALYLFDANKKGKDTQYRIHGTNDPHSIGRNMSSGCIRLLNRDIIDLYGRVGIGTKVVVL